MKMTLRCPKFLTLIQQPVSYWGRLWDNGCRFHFLMLWLKDHSTCRFWEIWSAAQRLAWVSPLSVIVRVVVHGVHIIGPPSHWSPISLVPHLIGPPSHWSPISLIPQLAPMHHSFHWSPISLVPPTHWSPISLVPHLIGPLLIGPLIHKSPLHYLNSLVPLLIGPPFH